MSDLCKNCGESIWLHDFMDYSGECDNECEEFKAIEGSEAELEGTVSS